MEEVNPLILDPALSETIRRPTAELSSAILRFIRHYESNDVTTAVERAVCRLLRAYSDRFPSEKSRISVRWLCELEGVEMFGIPKREKEIGIEPGGVRSKTRIVFYQARYPRIYIDERVGQDQARMDVAHELGHLLIHRLDGKIERALLKPAATVDEETIAEYIGRRLLIFRPFARCGGYGNEALKCVAEAGSASVPLLSAMSRRGDPDVGSPNSLVGAILWKLRGPTSVVDVADRLTPQWHLCPSHFIPLYKCKAKEGSLVAALAAAENDTVDGVREEYVAIGKLKGTFNVSAYAWGSLARGTRKVLMVLERAGG